MKKVCYYELLGVVRDASDEDLKKAYRRKALENHPDKNPTKVEEATALFAEIRNAYEVLSDPNERAWYDSHRESILRGEDEGDFNVEDEETQGRYFSSGRGTSTDQLLRFFSAGVYTDYSESPSGFFRVFGSLFNKLEEEELAAWEIDNECIKLEDPDFSISVFGVADTLFEDGPKNLYAKFLNFSTVKSFRWYDKYRLSDAPDRAIKRAMERENLKGREPVRKEYNETVRRLAEYVQKRDPRYKSYLERMKELRLQKEREQKERLKLERTERRNKMKDFQEQDWMKTASVEDMLDTYDDFEDAEENQDEYFCAACSKVFKTEKQWLNHEQSKKHIKNVEFLRAQLLEEDEAIAQELGEVDDDFIDASSEIADGLEDVTLESQAMTLESETEFGGKKTDDVAEGLYDEPIELSDVDIEVEVEIPKLKRRAKKNKKPAYPMLDDSYFPNGQNSELHQDLSSPLEDLEINLISQTNEEVPRSNSETSEKKAQKATPKQRKAAKVSTSSSSAASSLQCGECNEDFPSRNKLFDHLKVSGHATHVSSKGTKKKKR